jgi:manganese-dependent inorganic pyrophosphatase
LLVARGIIYSIYEGEKGMGVVVTGRNTGLISVVCAVILADFLNKQGLEAIPVSPGLADPGAARVLRRFGLKRPLTDLSLAGRQVVLVGTFPPPAGAELLARMDPSLPAAFAPVCALPAGQRQERGYASFLKARYDACGMELSRGLAGALLCILLTETDCLQEAAADDLKTAESLARLAGVADIAALGRDLA